MVELKQDEKTPNLGGVDFKEKKSRHRADNTNQTWSAHAGLKKCIMRWLYSIVL